LWKLFGFSTAFSFMNELLAADFHQNKFDNEQKRDLLCKNYLFSAIKLKQSK